MTKAPVVSVLMTSFNREDYISEAIESVLASTYKDYELIIVDDCSIDNTFEIAKDFQRKDSRIKLYLNDFNIGQFENRNRAASYAKGKYIKYLDSDDLIEPWGLAYCVEAMEAFPEAGLGTFYLTQKSMSESCCLSSEGTITKHFFEQNLLSIGPSGTIIKREAFERIGGFDPRFGVASDNYFNIILAANSPVVLLPDLFIFYREHPGQEKNNAEGYLINNYNLHRDLFDNKKLPLSIEQIQFHRRKLDKRFSVDLVKYFFNNPSVSHLQKIFSATDFNFKKFVKGFTY